MLRPRQWPWGFPGPSQTPGYHPLGFSHVAGIPPETKLLGSGGSGEPFLPSEKSLTIPAWGAGGLAVLGGWQ